MFKGLFSSWPRALITSMVIVVALYFVGLPVFGFVVSMVSTILFAIGYVFLGLVKIILHSIVTAFVLSAIVIGVGVFVWMKYGRVPTR